MSSPPALDFPSSHIDDVEMNDGTVAEQSMPDAPSPGNPLFLAATPSHTTKKGYGQESFRYADSKAHTSFHASSPMAFPSSSPVKTPQRRAARPLDAPPNSDPLDFPSSPIIINKTPKNRRGDIHSSLAITPSSSGRRPRPPSDELDEIRAIWGTTVNLAETMRPSHDFLKGFKPKYRVSYDRELGLKTRAFTSPAEGEAILYEKYFRRMRQTAAQSAPEVIPAMDQVLKDLMPDIADMDHGAGLEGMQDD
ncbi:hypothetical protein BYT27DRAFT_7254353 [Phlegmacium glaucopus]|nr:hypothetical protein BYT27DRAFT_7254353 [Phlegmacium glaucopus]